MSLVQTGTSGQTCRFVSLVAMKTYDPLEWYDASERFQTPITTTVQQSIAVREGSAGPLGSLTFSFETPTVPVQCTYIAVSSGEYALDSCDNPLVVAGGTIVATAALLHVN